MSRRPCVSGKFLECDGQRLFVRGVTYGTFRPQPDGSEYPARLVVEKDFSLMAANGINAVRTYTVPPTWLLDAAEHSGLYVLVGLPLERYVGYLNDPRRAPDFENQVGDWVRPAAGHPAVLCYSLANEIPAAIVRWHGRRKIVAFLESAYHAARNEDPAGLFSYVSYPSTEYLDLPFLDLVSMNVYLEQRERLDAYLARLQNLAADRPLLMTELGLDSRRNGEDEQARSLGWQIRTAFAAGCAGAFAYAWTDEWHRGGEDVEDWDFGLTRRDRSAKPALGAVRDAFASIPLAADHPLPRFSVVVCTYNGSGTLRECLEGISRLEYPNHEVIVIDDGSTDDSAAIASEFDVRLIRTEQNGLSAARNAGLAAADGDIVAYIDDDAWPDPLWLHYLAEAFEDPECAAAGGPNLPPPEDGWLADCVADAPGGPAHVLIGDRDAEHLPGCNLAIRRDRLQAIGGFDVAFRTAGDDVDVCWRLRERGWRLGFHAAALVWHHRRGSLLTYWRQQSGYGRAEALLERKWPERYNEAGHTTWAGRVYGAPLAQGRGRIYQGVWGSAPFQSLYQRAEHPARALPSMPEWYLATGALGLLGLLGLSWPPLLMLAPVALGFAALSVGSAVAVSARAPRAQRAKTRSERWKRRAVTAWLHLVQPLARTRGRLRHGLTPWRRHAVRGFHFPRARSFALWSDDWQAPDARLVELESRLRATGALVSRGGEFDRYDLDVAAGILGAARVLLVCEEHGQGEQLIRIRATPRVGVGTRATVATGALLALAAGVAGASVAAAVLGLATAALATRAFFGCAAAMDAVTRALDATREASAGRLRPISETGH
jgi:GT2 family glycosyltransferase